MKFAETPSERTPDVPEGRADCKTEAKGWSCKLPAAQLDIGLYREGCAPVYLWNVTLSSEAPLDLGELKCVQGGSLIGQTVDLNGDAIPGALVSLVPSQESQFSSGFHDATEAERARRRALTAQSNLRGYFQLTDIAPGVYEVEAVKKGFAITHSERPVSLEGDLEIELDDPLIMSEPRNVILHLRPSCDPNGDPWIVRFTPMADITGMLTGKVPVDAPWEHGEIAPGFYDLVVRDEKGNTWLRELVEADAGLADQPIEFSFDIPLVEIGGSVTRGGEPVAGALRLGQRHAEREVELTLDEEGAFFGHLPEAGDWWVLAMAADTPGSSVSLGHIQVSDKERNEYELEIPDTYLAGEVVDVSGAPVEGATVRVAVQPEATGGRNSKGRPTLRHPPSHLTTGAGGTFEFRGLPPGHLTLMAQEEERMSDNVQLELTGERDPPRQNLVLRENRPITLQVVSSQGAISGAGVFGVEDITVAQKVGFTRSTVARVGVTDVYGTTSLLMPEDVGQLLLLVRASGFGARILRIPVEDGRPITVELTPGGGFLVVDLSATAGKGSLYVDGVPAPLAIMRAYLGSLPEQGMDRFTLGPLESGRYSVCSPGSVPGGTAESCNSAFLPAGGRLILATPTSGDPVHGSERSTL